MTSNNEPSQQLSGAIETVARLVERITGAKPGTIIDVIALVKQYIISAHKDFALAVDTEDLVVLFDILAALEPGYFEDGLIPAEITKAIRSLDNAHNKNWSKVDLKEEFSKFQEEVLEKINLNKISNYDAVLPDNQEMIVLIIGNRASCITLYDIKADPSGEWSFSIYLHLMNSRRLLKEVLPAMLQDELWAPLEVSKKHTRFCLGSVDVRQLVDLTMHEPFIKYHINDDERRAMDERASHILPAD